MREHESPQYPPRTALNVRDSDVTIRIATNFESPGEKLTLKMIRQYGKEHFDVDPMDESLMPEQIVEWIRDNNAKVINVAGNSERSSPGITDFATAIMFNVLELLNE